MTTTYRMVVHCDENLTGECLGLAEYAGRDRLDLARKSDDHTSQSGWLRGYSKDGSYDACPVCRKQVEKRMKEAQASE